MDNVSEKLGLYDFFNVISVGAIFIIHIVFLFPDLLSSYDVWIKDSTIKFTGLFILAYLLGLIFQELGAFLDEYIIKFRNKKITFLKKRITRSFLINDKIIDNNIKLKQYRKYAREILENKEFKVCDALTPEQNEYIYSYIEYYIEHKNRSKKFEKMRALYGMSKSLFCSMLILFLVWLFCYIPTVTSVTDIICIVRLVVTPIYIIISTIIYYSRSKRCMKYRVRMMMGVYESCIEEKETL